MSTQCTATQFQFHPFGRREVVARFDAGYLSSDGGALLLREADRRLDLTRRMARCFADARQLGRVEHTVAELVAQRVHGLALGYEDLNDHDRLRSDPLLALAAGKADPTGMDRARDRDRGHALAGSSTLNRLELGDPEADGKRRRYGKVVAKEEALERLLVELFLESRGKAPETLWLDLDATDDPLHGAQQGRFFRRSRGHAETPVSDAQPPPDAGQSPRKPFLPARNRHPAPPPRSTTPSNRCRRELVRIAGWTRSCGPDLPTPCTPPRWSVGATAVPWAFRAAPGPRAEPGEGVVCGIVRRQWISHRLSGKSTERSEVYA